MPERLAYLVRDLLPCLCLLLFIALGLRIFRRGALILVSITMLTT